MLTYYTCYTAQELSLAQGREDESNAEVKEDAERETKDTLPMSKQK
jgi:hypothetical protein